jgi:hypothetical protein
MYCLELVTSPALPLVNGMGYETAVLVRMIEPSMLGSVLLGSILAAPGHSFQDYKMLFTVNVESITPEVAVLRIGVLPAP